MLGRIVVAEAVVFLTIRLLAEDDPGAAEVLGFVDTLKNIPSFSVVDERGSLVGFDYANLAFSLELSESTPPSLPL